MDRIFDFSQIAAGNSRFTAGAPESWLLDNRLATMLRAQHRRFDCHDPRGRTVLARGGQAFAIRAKLGEPDAHGELVAVRRGN
jgi:hypothetical protein